MTRRSRTGRRVSAALATLLVPCFVLAGHAGAAQPRLITPTNVSIVTAPTSVVEGQPFQVTVTVGGSSGTPTGMVQVQAANGQVLCNIGLTGGSGSCGANPLLDNPSPTYQLTGLYEGDGTYASAQGSTTIDLHQAATTTTLNASSSSAQKFSSVYLTATVLVTAPGTGSADVAPVVFSDNGVPITTPLPDCDGIEGYADQNPYTVTCVINAIAPGTHVYAATYAGDNSFGASTAASVTVNSAATPTMVSGGSETSSPIEGQKIFLSSGVITGSTDAEGEVTFSIGNLVLCSTGTSAGTAGCFTTAEPTGTHTVTVSFFDPSGIFAPSSSTFVLTVRGLTSAVGIAANHTGSGYWITDAQGDVGAFGSALSYGSLTGTALNAPISHIVSTPDGLGYWLVAADGGTFSFGDAQFYGSMGGQHLNAPVVAMAPTADGAGYWLVASDGGIFAFGDAHFFGSMGGTHLNRQVVGIVADDATGGYWEVATDGGIFAFNAHFYGSTGNIHLNQPVNGMASTGDDGGYLFVASDGGIFTYGDAGFFGSMGSTKLASPIVGMAPDWGTGGYWLVGADGGVFNFNAPFDGAH